MGFPGCSEGKESACNAGDPVWLHPYLCKQKRRKGTTEDEMVEWHHRLNGRGSEQTLGDGKGQGSLAGCSPYGHKESDTTEWVNNKFSIPLGKFQKKVIARSYGKSMISYIRNCQTVCQSGCAVLYSYQQVLSFPVVPHPHWHLVLSVFWILAILKSMSGEGNGTPLQYFCLKNPMDGGAW